LNDNDDASGKKADKPSPPITLTNTDELRVEDIRECWFSNDDDDAIGTKSLIAPDHDGSKTSTCIVDTDTIMDHDGGKPSTSIVTTGTKSLIAPDHDGSKPSTSIVDTDTFLNELEQS
jgi:hypothetical protein